MLFDSLAKFYEAGQRQYNPHTHQYEGSVVQVGQLPVNVTDVGTDRSVQVLGNLNSNSRALRSYEEPPAKWDYLTLDDDPTKFRLVTKREPLKLYTLIVGEDNGSN